MMSYSPPGNRKKNQTYNIKKDKSKKELQGKNKAKH